LSRSTQIYEFVMKLWPLSKVAFKLGNQPFVGPFIRPLFSTRMNQIVIIPINEVIHPGQNLVLPSALLTPLIEDASARFILSHCMCRRNENCQTYPQTLGCLYLGDGATQINPELGRLVSPEEAISHVSKSIQHGLVPLIAHTLFDSYVLGIPYRRMLTICFCCDCCCGVRHGLRMGPPAFWDVVNRLPGLNVTVGDNCAGCETCLEVCAVRAISMKDGRACIGEQCKGCGRCVDACPVGAIELRLENNVDILHHLQTHLAQRTDIKEDGKLQDGLSQFRSSCP
jgi:Fe-S-cluster-containing hydrogenase component 2